MKTCGRESNSSGGFFDVPAKREELRRIEAQASAPDFWSDQEEAQKLMGRRSRLEKVAARHEKFESEISDASVLFEFAEEDADSLGELRALVERLEREIKEAETEMLLSGESDARNAICTIHPGAGGKTFYTRQGDLFVALCAVVAAIGMISTFKLRRSRAA